MQVKSTAECSLEAFSAKILTCIKLPPVFKTFILPNFVWLLTTGLTVLLTFLFVGFIVFPEPLKSVLQFPFLSTTFIVDKVIEEQSFQGFDVERVDFLL